MNTKTVTLEDIKTYAKRISKGTGMNHNAAREAAATKFGYVNFADAQRKLTGTISGTAIMQRSTFDNGR